MKGAITAIAVAIALNVALLIWGRGSFFHYVVAFAMILYVALPAFLIALLLLMLRRRFQTSRRLQRFVVATGLVASSGLLSLSVGSQVLNRDVNTAKRYCESLVPKLETYKGRVGSYPADISAVAPPEEPPRLLRRSRYYGTDGDEFNFSFVDPAAMMGGFSYDSRSHAWRYWD